MKIHPSSIQVAYVVGVQWGGRGEVKFLREGRGESERRGECEGRGEREVRSLGSGGNTRLRGSYFFSRFYYPTDECKNPDWSELTST